MDMTGWPKGDAAHRPQGTTPPGVQLRFDDVHGVRITAFAASATGGRRPDLELRH